MNKAEALEYIESCEEALWRTGRYSTGQRVILLGYGYVKGYRWNDPPVAKKGATGVMVRVLKADGSPVEQCKVAQLRHLYATTWRAENDRQEEGYRLERERQQQIDQEREDALFKITDYAPILGVKPDYDHVESNYRSPVVRLKLTVAEAAAVIDRIQALEASVIDLIATVEVVGVESDETIDIRIQRAQELLDRYVIHDVDTTSLNREEV